VGEILNNSFKNIINFREKTNISIFDILFKSQSAVRLTTFYGESTMKFLDHFWSDKYHWPALFPVCPEFALL
jgi:hypothetical protein